MERRPLGESGLEVSVLALGTWAMSGAVESWGHVDDRESIATIHQAIDCGINLIDTAPVYGLGHSEEVLGKAIRGRRHEVVIATKCGLLFPRSKNELPPRCLSRASILRECEASLRRLQTDFIDLYQCHWPDPAVPLRETISALTHLLEQGKIRAIGVSNFNCEEIAAAREFGPVHSVQPPFSLLQRRAADDLLPYCQEHRIAALAYSPLAKGLLTGKFSATSTLSGIRARDPEYMGGRYQRNLSLVESLRAVASRLGRTVAQLALNWVAYHPGVTAPIVGAKRPSQILENVGGAGWQLSDEDRAEIGRLLIGSGHGG
ncbi:MAG: aldo/keto reductase [Planctomycetes bacterium]|nr:aldo/keto reductase [Planctomycetota bacterium]